MSPQRGGFSSGCKYKSNTEFINKDGSGDAPATLLCSRIPEEGQSLIFMMTIQHRDSSANIVLHMDHSQVHNSIGSIAKASVPTEIIMAAQHLRMMITTGHLVDHLTHDTVRATSRSLIEVMATPEDIISQRVTVSLNQNGCSSDQAVELNLWSLVENMKLRG